MIYAIGTVGQAVRLFLETAREDSVELQLQPGEVAFPVEEKTPSLLVEIDGEYALAPLPLNAVFEVGRLRMERDRRLAETDWTQVGDAPLTSAEKAAYRAYRTELRDLDLDAYGNDPEGINWPLPPILT